MATAVVHLLRHGQVHNPDGVLYERLPNFHLSALGRQMAARVAEYTKDFDLVHLRCSPLERAQETMEPVAANHPRVDVITDPRVIEASNRLAGQAFAGKLSQVLRPSVLTKLYNPLRPSWGEPYALIVARMNAALHDAAEAADGHEALIVSHQLPIWLTRRAAEGRRSVHDPRKRQATLCSLTSFTFVDGRITRVDYAEPARDLLPATNRAAQRKLVAGA